MEKYTVEEYLELLENEGLLTDAFECESIKERVVNLVSYNSKEVEKDTLFIVKGATFKAEYLNEAIENGVFVYVSEKKFDGVDNKTKLFQYSLDGKFIKEYESIVCANEEYSGLKSAKEKKKNEHKGFLWFKEFKGEELNC